MNKSAIEMLFDLTNDILNEYMELGIVLTEKCWDNDPAFKEIFDKTYDMFTERFDNIWDMIHYPDGNGTDEEGAYGKDFDERDL